MTLIQRGTTDPRGGWSEKPIRWHRYGDCMICTSHSGRYPEKQLYGVRRKIARHVFLRRYGDQPSSVISRHTCDNRKCINPDHIIPGTTRDNVNDCCLRGRNSKGVIHGNSKLRESDIREIRQLLLEGMTYSQIARHFGTTKENIYLIKHNKAWKHI